MLHVFPLASLKLYCLPQPIDTHGVGFFVQEFSCWASTVLNPLSNFVGDGPDLHLVSPSDMYGYVPLPTNVRFPIWVQFYSRSIGRLLEMIVLLFVTVGVIVSLEWWWLWWIIILILTICATPLAARLNWNSLYYRSNSLLETSTSVRTNDEPTALGREGTSSSAAHSAVIMASSL